MTLRGVILAGGKGTRLGELTKVTNKHLLPVGPIPMVYHPLKKMVGAGICDILLVSGTEHMGDFVELLGSGRAHGCNLTYRVQDEAGGIAQALGFGQKNLFFFCNTQGERIHQRVLRVARFETNFSTDGRHTKRISVVGDSANHTVQNAPVFRNGFGRDRRG